MQYSPFDRPVVTFKPNYACNFTSDHPNDAYRGSENENCSLGHLNFVLNQTAVSSKGETLGLDEKTNQVGDLKGLVLEFWSIGRTNT